MNHDLPPELQALAAHLDAQPGPVQSIFQYALALLMVEAGKAEFVDTTPSDNGPVCTFRTVAGDVFSLTRPPLDETQEVAVKATLRQILNEE